MQLVRNNLKPLIQLSILNSAHVGLLMQRGLSCWETNDKVEKAKLVERISEIKAPDFYELAFDRWFQLTQSENFSYVAAKVDGRLFTGLALGGTLETGMTTHHTYGTPLIAGSSIKGATRAYAESIDLPAELIKILFGSGNDQDDDSDKTAGSFVWHDAWWIPRDKSITLFTKEVITVHEQGYYSETTNVANGTESPVPNLQIGIQGEFYFVFEGDPNWARYVADLVAAMLEEQGLGAKTSSGYGYFVREPKLDNHIKRKQDEIALQQASASGDSSAVIRAQLSALDEKALADALTKGKNKLYDQLNLDKDSDDDMTLLAKIVMEEHADYVNAWVNESGNKDKAYKFVQKYLG